MASHTSVRRMNLSKHMEQIQTSYINNVKGIKALAAEYNVSPTMLRRALIEWGTPIRSPGRPRKDKDNVVLSQAL